MAVTGDVVTEFDRPTCPAALPVTPLHHKVSSERVWITVLFTQVCLKHRDPPIAVCLFLGRLRFCPKSLEFCFWFFFQLRIPWCYCRQLLDCVCRLGLRGICPLLSRCFVCLDNDSRGLFTGFQFWHWIFLMDGETSNTLISPPAFYLMGECLIAGTIRRGIDTAGRSADFMQKFGCR